MEGPSGVGKTTALLGELRELLPVTGGFGTCRLFDEKGIQRGFCHVAANELEGPYGEYRQGLPGMFIENGDGVFRFNKDFFRTTTLDMIKDDPRKKLYLLDEIGGTELLVPEFVDAIKHRLDSDVPCIGVWKASGNSMHMKRELCPGHEYDEAYSKLYGYINAHPNVTLLEVPERSGTRMREAVREWIAYNALL